LKLVLTGGVARTQSYELIGSLAEEVLASLNLDVVFLGVDGISPRGGLTTYNEAEAHTDLVMLKRAHRVVVVADSSKIGQIRFAQICPIELVDELITDGDVDRSVIAELRAMGVRVTVAGQSSTE
jgi:DeoR family transcriptional regulator, aga operon transcriptional repressor